MINLIFFTFFIAIIPTILLGYFIYKKDILEKEPIGLLMLLFISGVISTLPAAAIEQLIMPFIEQISDYTAYIFTLSFIGVALVEELCKALLTYEICWKNKNFNYVYDAIVYCVFTSLGFATLENVLYVTAFGMQAAVLRAIVSVPAHAFFGVSMGYYMGIAKYHQKANENKKKYINIVLSLIIPVTLHGIFDFLLLTNSETMVIIFFVFVLFMYIISYLKVKKHSKNFSTL